MQVAPGGVAPADELDAQLELPWVADSIRLSSTPTTWLKVVIGGMVASPTPTVPISADSTRVIRICCGVKSLEKKAADIHPAVPPPTITRCEIFPGFPCRLPGLAFRNPPARSRLVLSLKKPAGAKPPGLVLEKNPPARSRLVLSLKAAPPARSRRGAWSAEDQFEARKSRG
jgi:hypothetical protein